MLTMIFCIKSRLCGYHPAIKPAIAARRAIKLGMHAKAIALKTIYGNWLRQLYRKFAAAVRFDGNRTLISDNARKMDAHVASADLLVNLHFVYSVALLMTE